MAVDIDNVYQQVLAISNKDKRGYITPQEFNLFARKAQLDIFESIFHDYKMALLKPQTQVKLVDNIEMLREKIASHRVHAAGMTISDGGATGTLSSAVHWLENVYVNDVTSVRQVSFNIGPASGIIASPGAHTDTTQLRLRGTYSSSLNSDENTFTIHMYHNTVTPHSEHFQNPTSEVLRIAAAANEEALAQEVVDLINDASPFHTAVKDSTTHKITISYKSTAGIDLTTSENCHNFVSSNPTVTVSNTTGLSAATYEEVDKQDWLNVISGGAKLKPFNVRPVYHRSLPTKIVVSPASSSDLLYDYISRPADPKWTYVVINGKALFNASDASKQDFEVHASEEGTLVNKILELAGVSIGDPNLSEVALRNEAIKEAKENR